MAIISIKRSEVNNGEVFRHSPDSSLYWTALAGGSVHLSDKDCLPCYDKQNNFNVTHNNDICFVERKTFFRDVKPGQLFRLDGQTVIWMKGQDISVNNLGVQKSNISFFINVEAIIVPIPNSIS